MKVKSWRIKIHLQLVFILNHILQILSDKFQKFKHMIYMKKKGLKSQSICISVSIRSQGSFKLLKDQKLDTHLCSDRSESSSKSLVLLTYLLPSGENIFVLTTLITLIIVHITSIFIFPYVSYFKLNIYAALLYKNISESILYVLRISYWWDIRAIYRQYLHLKFCNFVYRWL